MKLVHVLAGASFAMLLGPVTSLAGSHPQNHKGFFIGFNLGAGVAAVRSTVTGETVQESGGAINIRLGGAVLNNVLLGAELAGWVRESSGRPVGIGNALFALTYYPARGLYFRAGMGFGSHFSENVPDGSAEAKDEGGVAWGLASGYEWRLTRHFALSPQVEFNWLNIHGEVIDKASYAAASLGFNWYW